MKKISNTCPSKTDQKMSKRHSRAKRPRGANDTGGVDELSENLRKNAIGDLFDQLQDTIKDKTDHVPQHIGETIEKGDPENQELEYHDSRASEGEEPHDLDPDPPYLEGELAEVFTPAQYSAICNLVEAVANAIVNSDTPFVPLMCSIREEKGRWCLRGASDSPSPSFKGTKPAVPQLQIAPKTQKETKSESSKPRPSDTSKSLGTLEFSREKPKIKTIITPGRGDTKPKIIEVPLTEACLSYQTNPVDLLRYHLKKINRLTRYNQTHLLKDAKFKPS